MDGGPLRGERLPRRLVLPTAFLLGCKSTDPASQWRGVHDDPPQPALA